MTKKASILVFRFILGLTIFFILAWGLIVRPVTTDYGYYSFTQQDLIAKDICENLHGKVRFRSDWSYLYIKPYDCLIINKGVVEVSDRFEDLYYGKLNNHFKKKQQKELLEEFYN